MPVISDSLINYTKNLVTGKSSIISHDSVVLNVDWHSEDFWVTKVPATYPNVNLLRVHLAGVLMVLILAVGWFLPSFLHCIWWSWKVHDSLFNSQFLISGVNGCSTWLFYLSPSLCPCACLLLSLPFFSSLLSWSFHVKLEQQGSLEWSDFFLASSRASTKVGSCGASYDLFLEDASWYFFLEVCAFIFNCVYVSLCRYVYVSLGTPRGQRLWIPLCHLTWWLEPNWGLLQKATSSLHHGATSLVPRCHFLSFN